MVARAPSTSMSATAANNRAVATVLLPQKSDSRPQIESEGPRRPLARRAADAAELPRFLRLLLPTAILIKEREDDLEAAAKNGKAYYY